MVEAVLMLIAGGSLALAVYLLALHRATRARDTYNPWDV